VGFDEVFFAFVPNDPCSFWNIFHENYSSEKEY
jgi:hypothetical protein